MSTANLAPDLSVLRTPISGKSKEASTSGRYTNKFITGHPPVARDSFFKCLRRRHSVQRCGIFVHMVRKRLCRTYPGTRSGIHYDGT